jgi:hypothetical protein
MLATENGIDIVKKRGQGWIQGDSKGGGGLLAPAVLPYSSKPVCHIFIDIIE